MSVFVARNDVLAMGNSDDNDVEYKLVFQRRGVQRHSGGWGNAPSALSCGHGPFFKVQVQNRRAALDEIEVEGTPCVPGNLTLAPASKTTDLVVCQNAAVVP